MREGRHPWVQTRSGLSAVGWPGFPGFLAFRFQPVPTGTGTVMTRVSGRSTGSDSTWCVGRSGCFHLTSMSMASIDLQLQERKMGSSQHQLTPAECDAGTLHTLGVRIYILVQRADGG